MITIFECWVELDFEQKRVDGSKMASGAEWKANFAHITRGGL